MGLNNGFIRPFRPPGETGGTLGTHEIVRQRINTIMNSRELMHVAIPLPTELQMSPERMEAAATHATKMIGQSMIEKQPDNVVEMPVRTEALDPAEAARQRVNDAFREAA